MHTATMMVGGLAALLLGTGSAVPAPSSGDIAVSTTVQLVAALKQARGGERILLAPGIYQPFSIRDVAPSRRVEMISRDPARPAILTGMNMRGGGNLALRRLVLRSAGTAVQEDFLFHSVRHLSFSDLVATGRPGPAGLQGDKILQLRECTDVSIARSDFSNAVIALSLLDNDRVSVTASYFHDLRMDAIRGGGSSHVLIARNFITGFSPHGKDHPDAIQFWTKRQTHAAQNIAVVENVILRGRGKAMQGIFMRDENGSLPYRNVRLADNLVVGAMFNGIAVLSESPSLTLSNNVVVAYPDQKSWIRVGSRSTLENNSAQLFLVGNKRVDPPRTNRVLPVRSDGGASALKAWAHGRNLDRYPPMLRRHVYRL